MKLKHITKCIALALLLSTGGYAQDNLSYQTPPQSIADLIDAPSAPGVSIDRKGEYMLLMERSELPSIAQLAEPELRIGGLRINPANNGPSRSGYMVGLKLRKLTGGEEIAIKGLPAKPLISNVQWSPDQSKIAFSLNFEKHIELWVADVATATASRVGEIVLNNASYGSPFSWLSDSQHLMAIHIPASRGAMPSMGNNVPKGAVIQENMGGKAPSRTYQDLLKNPEDEALFEYFMTGQLVKTDLKGTLTSIGAPALIRGFNTSPDGNYVMLSTFQRPFSYLVPASRFPSKIEIYDSTGKMVKLLAELPLSENLPTGFDAVATGQRGHSWRSDAPAMVYWVEAQDGGDPKKQVEVRDKVFTLDAPFNGEAKELFATKLRFSGITWGNGQLALATESWWATRKRIVSVINPTTRTGARVLMERSYEDTYNDPGSPLTAPNQYGRSVLAIAKGNNVMMLGSGASPEGDRPFVDIMNLDTKKTTRLWRSEAPYFESPVAVLDQEKQIIVTVRESQTESPNYFLRDLKKKTVRQITSFPDPYPQLKNITKQTLRYKREDGVELSMELLLPAGYKKEDGPLPAFLWAYPREYKSKDAAGQVSGSPYRYTRISWGSPIFWVTRGYAILNNATIPIVGEDKTEPNDTFVEQLVASAKAAIDETVKMGVVDPNRVGVGGHSYGAFMTANLLAHSDLFRAGIARSGAYNRTLTPFGFQSEERTYWEAPDVYNRMSPFMNANKVNEPILLIHGEADNNAGTFPLQSERFYNALKGHGATTRFVLLPHESHGYSARESVLHMLWEMDNWLEKYVKNAKVNE